MEIDQAVDEAYVRGLRAGSASPLPRPSPSAPELLVAFEDIDVTLGMAAIPIPGLLDNDGTKVDAIAML